MRIPRRKRLANEVTEHPGLPIDGEIGPLRRGDSGPGGGLSFPAFVDYLDASLRRELVAGSEPVTPASRIVADLDLDELEVCDVVAALEAINSSFLIPDGVNIMDVTVGDLYFYSEHMTEDNHQ